MKKILIFLVVFLLFSFPVLASDAQRKVSSGEITTSQAIKTSPGTVYGLEIVPTSANGYAVVFDSTSGSLGGKTKLTEVRGATQYDSKYRDFGKEGIKAYEGIYLFVNNATAIVHYY